MLYTERANYILRKLERDSLVKINDLVREMNVSIDTIRRDLRKLEEEGLLTCIRGGACLPEAALQCSPFFGRQIVNEDAKRTAARKAVSLIHTGNVIALNAGTTNFILAEELLKLNKQITVVTNNLAAISILLGSENIQIIVPGGIADKKEEALYGQNCIQELTGYSFDICFLSINALDVREGYSDFRFQEIDVIQAILRHSKTSAAIMDSSKFGKISKKLFLPTSRIHMLITDDSADSVIISELKELGVSVI